jgi:hypothetical protein
VDWIGLESGCAIAYIDFRYMSNVKTRVILSLTIFCVSKCYTTTVQHVYRRWKLMMIEKSFEISEADKKAKAKSKKDNFGKTVMDVVENVFSSLGEQCKQALYFHLKNRYNIGKKEIPSKIEEFAEALEQILGSGAKLIEIEIMKLLFSKVQTFKYSPRQEILVFTDYLEKLGEL